MKLLAFYLPQFHKVKENDEWWGEGFTDWIPTRNAEPLCAGHYQPHIPLNGNYYDLLNKSTLRWQAKLMQQYGIDGMCFYHYYFKDGRKILEKPAELLLENGAINMPFCFYWANETWKRSWSNVPNANVWQSDDGRPQDINDSGVLLDQQYGEEKDWIEHFNYFLPFFKDKRYIRVEGKPLVILYRTSLIPCLGAMIDCWQKRAVKEGLSGIYIIGAFVNESSKRCLDGVVYHEPPQALVTLREAGIGDSAYSISYDQIIDYVLQEPMTGTKTYFSCFTGFDDTPRRGTRGNALKDVTPEKYELFLAKTIAKNRAAGNEITFINAWNEWGEGMHLEPDEKYRYAFLEATQRAKRNSFEYNSEYENFFAPNNIHASINILQNKADKFEQYMRLLDRWMELRENGIRISEYFEEKEIKNIAIYGYGNFGRHLYWELRDCNVEVRYLIDRQGQKLSDKLKVYMPDDKLPEVDVIVISTFWIYDDVKKIISESIKTVSLDEIIRYFQDR